MVAAPAGAATRFVRIAGTDEPGTPARYDRVGILKVGAPAARNVLVLNPGTSASAGRNAFLRHLVPFLRAV